MKLNPQMAHAKTAAVSVAALALAWVKPLAVVTKVKSHAQAAITK
jgi:hypothetical protein